MVFAKTQGKGAAVLLIHGIMSDHTYYDRLAEDLMEDFYLIRYDRRGYGQSPKEEDCSIEAQAEDAKELIRRFSEGEDPVIVVAHSAGGMIALKLAALHPEFVKGIVLIETPVAVKEEDQKRLKEWNQELNGYVKAGQLTRALPAFQRQIGANGHSGRAEPMDAKKLMMLRHNLNAFMLGELNAIQNHQLTLNELRQLKPPVCMFLTNMKEDSIYTRAAKNTADVLGWEQHTLNGNHNIVSLDPAEFAGAFRKLTEKWT